MTAWNEKGGIFTNVDDIYKDFRNRTGSSTIKHFGLLPYGDPAQESFLKELEITQHIYSVGDSLSKIAYNNYGDAKLWWVLAWFNSRPTEFHCKIGDTILVPKPLETVLVQAYNVVDL